MARYFPALLRHELLSTKNYLDVVCPYFVVPVQVWDNTSRSIRPKIHHFLWDTGASLTMVSRQFASTYSLRMHEVDDRLPDGITGVGGNQAAWLTTMKIRFPTLSRRRRDADLVFPFHVIVVEHLDTLILGTRDVLQNFTVESTWDGTSFTLVRDHHGEVG